MKETKATEETKEEKQINNAALRVLQTHRGGEVLSDLSEALQKVTEAVSETGRPGSFSIKMTLRPASKGAALAIVVEDDITIKLPKQDKVGSVFFADTENWTLQRDNPKQLPLALKEVPGASAPAELKQVEG